MKNHTNLQSNTPLHELPEWFQNAKTLNAVVIYKDGILTWEDGIWKCGTWEGGIWKDGIWEGGIWKYGIWEGGIWKCGTWERGTWEGGTWKDGIWEDGYKQIGQCKWIVFYSKENIKIGCKIKSIEEWNNFFVKSDEEFETKRGTPEFEKIYKCFLLAKYAIELNI